MRHFLFRPGSKLSNLLLILLPAGAQAAAPDFSNALEAAWQNLPEQTYLSEEKRISGDASPSWLAAAPSVSLTYQQGDNASATAEEWQTNVELPLARPALISSQRDYRDASAAETSARVRLLRWQLAGQLQTWWWDWRSVQQRLQRTQQRLSAMEQQLQWLNLLIRQGERPAADRLAVQEQYQSLKNQLLTDNRQQQLLQQQWQQWTGLPAVPAGWQFSQLSELPLDQHPLLQMLRAQQQQADAQFRSNENSRFNPRLNLGVKHTEALAAQPSADVMQLGISVDFGHSSYSGRRDAIRQLSSSHADWLRSRQQLERERQITAASLPQLQLRWQELEAMSQEAASQYDGQYKAYQRGTLSGFQWLQIQNSIWQLQQQADDARIQYFRTISQWNQLQGHDL